MAARRRAKSSRGLPAPPRPTPTPRPCTQTIYSGQCLELPVKLRDFKSEKQTGGHPDFFYYGAPLRRQTLSTSAACRAQTNPLSLQQALLRAELGRSRAAERRDGALLGDGPGRPGRDGRPAFDTTRNGGGANATLCDCQFTDWSIGGNGGHVPGTQWPTARSTVSRTSGERERESDCTRVPRPS